MKIKTIKSNLQAVINYGKNGEKTENGILEKLCGKTSLMIYQ